MILTHGANSLAMGGDFVKIGGRKYPVVKIGNQLWMAENLDWKYPNLTIGGSFKVSSPMAWYYNNDEATYGFDGRRCGLLYNWYAAVELNELLSDGWRVPSKDDLTDLVNSIGSSSDSSPIRSDDVDWATSWEGTNDSLMNVLPAGGVYNNFYGLAERAGIISLDYDNDDVWFLYVDETRMTVQETDKKFEGEGIRLVKDAP